ncbi:uncharacterized protein [Littorina saxatilis]|uniref:Uncharacterized protein n=1 Tax=Littorina saxatilis TaxID=31220 RepID=A0AAN9BA76_9CAEN
MAASKWWSTFFAIFGFLIDAVRGGEFCWQQYYTSSTFCSYGCCGSNGSSYCCSAGVSVALIVGCVLGGIAMLSFIIAVVCCCIKKKGHSGRVVSPGTLQSRPAVATVTTVTTGSTGHYSTHHTAGFYPEPQPSAPFTGYGYGANHLPPLSQPPHLPPAYDAHPPPPPAYSIYNPQGYAYGQGESQGQATPQYGYGQGQSQGQSQGQATPQYGYGQGSAFSGQPGTGTPAPWGQPTTQYGNNFVV